VEWLGANMPFTEHELELGLQHYVGVDGYLIACSYHGTWRVDLDGQPRGAVAAGARGRLALRRARRRTPHGSASA